MRGLGLVLGLCGMWGLGLRRVVGVVGRNKSACSGSLGLEAQGKRGRRWGEESTYAVRCWL